jgi:pyrophosphatase PpaX
MPGQPRALLWDIDGTLIDTTGLITAALDHIYRKYLGRTLPPNGLRAIIGTPLAEQIRVFGDPADYGADPAAMEADFIRFYEANQRLERIVQAAVDALILGNRAGRPTALVTSKNLAEIQNTLPRLGVAPFVDAVVSADDVHDPKPHPEGVLLALERLNAPAEEAVFIGDTVHDLRAGRAAGVARCAVTWGAGPRETLLAEAPEIVCDDPQDLPRLLDLGPEHRS